jgi:hypothetical protein
VKVLVCGSREWADKKAIEREFQQLPQGTTIVHGACPTGADALAEAIAMKFGFSIRRYPADWTQGKKAGPLRNAQMVRLEHRDGEPMDLVLAFTPDLERSRGTRDCVGRARKAGIRVVVLNA